MRASIFSLALILALTACTSKPKSDADSPPAPPQASQPQPSPSPSPPATAEPSPAQPSTPQAATQAVIHGRATYRERIKMAPGADFTVQLIDNQLADTPQAVIATTRLDDVAGPPYEFTLPYDASKIRPNGMYG